MLNLSQKRWGKRVYGFTKARGIERNLSDEIHANKRRLQNATGKAREYIEKQIEFAKGQSEQVRKDIKGI
ncbi:hypothetical protein AB6N09_04845 [Wolbachia endosymbiont of Tettigetta isshikii]|uniref:hypothetical protein n=1 Tax=Wolbachia endosymbiont of Tettigetta isshikii TaxID=3239093 RepID=UPI00397EB1E1